VSGTTRPSPYVPSPWPGRTSIALSRGAENREIKHLVLIEPADDDVRGKAADDRRSCVSLKGAVSVAQPHTELAPIRARNEIEHAVAVEVVDREGAERVPEDADELEGLKGPVAVAREQAHQA
jgi:hypothetical protein